MDDNQYLKSGLPQSSVFVLADWIRANFAKVSHHPLTHLKLQKLVFYAYCALAGHEKADCVGIIPFEAWEHGPVNRDLWERYRDQGANPIPGLSASESCPKFDHEVTDILNDALAIYGVMDAWTLRNQSHLEKLWQDAYTKAKERRTYNISAQELNDWAREKYAPNVPFELPEQITHKASLALESVPVTKEASFSKAAECVRRIFSKLT